MKRNLLVVPMLAAFMLLLFFSSAASAEIAVGISVRVGPPALPVYAQPVCPGPGYIWTPGYWAWSDESGYYWVPGTWVVAPVGMLWTPGYWGWNEGLYVWHAGYWGPHVGFYGGINYGFGYGGVGFVGGEWRHGAFFYNRSVTNVNVVHVTNVYNRTVIVNNETRVSYNGGRGGIEARPSRGELFAEREPHRGALSMQTEHEHAASRNRELFASENHGRPGIAATARPGEFRGHSAVAARSAGAPYRAPEMSPREARGPSSTAGRPGNGRENNRGNESFHKFGEPQHANNGRGEKFGNSAERTNDAWRSSRPNGNAPRPVSQDMPVNNSRGNQAEAHGSPHSAPAPHQNAQRPSESRPRENRSGKERER